MVVSWLKQGREVLFFGLYSKGFQPGVAGEVDGADQRMTELVSQVRCPHVTENGARGWGINFKSLNYYVL